ncbi:MAG TPA: phosphoenolpyruvate carboxykinase domain-containing protein, partial [Methylomirabilota bacterium]|nr:phosphoenolpyruvate carboxykinase domain-containing protein [Methylomirabilota bacterium]
VPVHQCPSVAPNWEDPQGVPISGLIFGSRRTQVIPLVFEAFDWNHGVYVAASVASETTAAQSGAIGVVRRDPMAMLPFCGYNMADYFAHWLGMQPRLARPPHLFRVNWFRRGADGKKFLWPGYSENVRVLKWIVERIRGTADAVETPIGWIPTADALDTEGLRLSRDTLAEALRADAGEWLDALADLGSFYDQFGDRLPREIASALADTRRRFGA